MKFLADRVKTRKRVTIFEYKTGKDNKKRKIKMSARV
jgi:RecB family exonuclease